MICLFLVLFQVKKQSTLVFFLSLKKKHLFCSWTFEALVVAKAKCIQQLLLDAASFCLFSHLSVSLPSISLSTRLSHCCQIRLCCHPPSPSQFNITATATQKATRLRFILQTVIKHSFFPCYMREQSSESVLGPPTPRLMGRTVLCHWMGLLHCWATVKFWFGASLLGLTRGLRGINQA